MMADNALPRPRLHIRRRYWLRLVILILIAMVGTAMVVPFVKGYSAIWGLTHPGTCNAGSDPSGFNPKFEDVSFTSTNGLTLKAYFIPGTNGATIIMPPAYADGRGAEMDVAKVFNQAGFTVFTLDSRACTAHGWISLGYQEVEDVQAAYQYLKSRPDVDATKVGLHGFSSAGATAMMSAERMPEIRSVSAEGGYADYATTLGLGQDFDFLTQLYQFGVVVGYRVVTGDDIHILSPINNIDKIAPRPLLLVYGSLEVSLPGARDMLAKAQADGIQADLWVVNGADHGQYLLVAPDEFAKRLVGFHEAALLGSKPS